MDTYGSAQNVGTYGSAPGAGNGCRTWRKTYVGLGATLRGFLKVPDRCFRKRQASCMCPAASIKGGEKKKNELASASKLQSEAGPEQILICETKSKLGRCPFCKIKIVVCKVSKVHMVDEL